MGVPFNDLGRALDPIWGDVYRSLKGCVERVQFLRGPMVKRFEEEFAKAVGAMRAVAVSSGTDAIALSLRALGIRGGESVYTPAFGCPATAAAIAQAGGIPRFVDVGRESGLATADAYAALYGEGEPAAVVPVHLFGRLAEVRDVKRLSSRTAVVEDCCQAFGTPGAGRHGDAAAWSVYPSKNLGAWGDGGVVTTDDQDVADEVARLRHYGADETWQVERFGYNSRMDEIQAAVLLAKMPYVQRWHQQRARAAALYRLLLPPALLGRWAGAENLHLMPIRAHNRPAFREALAARGIQTGVHYERSLPSLAACGGDDSAFPEAAAWAREEVSLPMFPGIRDSEVRAVCDAVRESVQKLVDRRPVRA